LIIEARLVSNERVVIVLPPEQAQPGALWVAAQRERFVFYPGREFLHTAAFSSPPVELTVRYLIAKAPGHLQSARWKRAK